MYRFPNIPKYISKTTCIFFQCFFWNFNPTIPLSVLYNEFNDICFSYSVEYIPVFRYTWKKVESEAPIEKHTFLFLQIKKNTHTHTLVRFAIHNYPKKHRNRNALNGIKAKSTRSKISVSIIIIRVHKSRSMTRRFLHDRVTRIITKKHHST